MIKMTMFLKRKPELSHEAFVLVGEQVEIISEYREG